MREDFIRAVRILGVDENATFEEIQSAYRKLVLKYHPDVNHTKNAATRFRMIVEAYGTLIDIISKEKSISGSELISRLSNDSVTRTLGLNELAIRLQYSASPKVRAHAAAALAVKGDNESRHLLFRALSDEDMDVRQTVVQLLGETGRFMDIFRLIFWSLIKREIAVKTITGAVTRILHRSLGVIPAFHQKVMTNERGAA